MATNDENNKTNALEAALFIYGEPMSFKKIGNILGIETAEVPELVLNLQKELESRGLAIIINDEAAQLVTKPDFSGMVETIVKEELSSAITPAALETLAIVSYLGPLSRSRIDYIRGVNSSYILRNLLLRGLVERTPDPERGNAFLYKASFDLLKFFGISSIKELPGYEHYKNLLAKTETALGGEVKEDAIVETSEKPSADLNQSE